MTHYVALLYISQLTGLIMTIGGIVLIYKQKIDINRVTKDMEITVPFFGKLRTNTPALALFVIGFFPILYPIQKLKTEYMHVQQNVDSDVHPVVIYAVVNTKTIQSGVGRFDLSIPVLPVEDYSPQIVYVAGTMTASQDVDPKQTTYGLITLRQGKVQGTNEDVKPDIVAPPERYK